MDLYLSCTTLRDFHKLNVNTTILWSDEQENLHENVKFEPAR